MNGILTTGELAWLSYRPPEHRDIRRIFKKFWKKSKAEEERAKRIEMLSTGRKTDRKLARALRDAKPGEPAAVYCCPLLARKFQIFFVSRALRVGEVAKDDGIPITLFDPKTAVPFSKLNDIDWRKLHGQHSPSVGTDARKENCCNWDGRGRGRLRAQGVAATLPFSHLWNYA